MFSIFSTREIAGAFYFTILLIIICSIKQTRYEVIKLIKCAAKWKIIIPFIILMIYTCVIVYILSFLPFWKYTYIKDIVMWTLFVGIPYSYNAVIDGEQDKYFISTFKENIKLVVLLEFFIGTFTFNLIIEIILQFGIALIVFSQITASTNKEWELTSKFLNGLLSLTGIIILFFTVKAAMGSYSDIDPIDTVISFCIPIVFSILFIPCAYMFALISKYENMYLKWGFKEPKERKIRWKRHISVFILCGMSYKKLCAFYKIYVQRLHVNLTQQDFEEIIRDFKILYRRK